MLRQGGFLPWPLPQGVTGKSQECARVNHLNNGLYLDFLIMKEEFYTVPLLEGGFDKDSSTPISGSEIPLCLPPTCSGGPSVPGAARRGRVYTGHPKITSRAVGSVLTRRRRSGLRLQGRQNLALAAGAGNAGLVLLHTLIHRSFSPGRRSSTEASGAWSCLHYEGDGHSANRHGAPVPPLGDTEPFVATVPNRATLFKNTLGPGVWRQGGREGLGTESHRRGLRGSAGAPRASRVRTHGIGSRFSSCPLSPVVHHLNACTDTAPPKGGASVVSKPCCRCRGRQC